MQLKKGRTLLRWSKIIRKIDVNEQNSEKSLVLDLLLNNGFKAYNISTLAYHAALLISMDRYKRND